MVGVTHAGLGLVAAYRVGPGAAAALNAGVAQPPAPCTGKETGVNNEGV